MPVVGMVGAGQLARMTHQAAVSLGSRLRVLAGGPEDSAALAGAEVELGSHEDLEALTRFAAGNDVTTFDHELVPPEHLQALERAGHVLRPGPPAKLLAQDKRHQREVLARHGFPVPSFRPVGSHDELAAFGDEHGWPVVAKAPRGGYDGRGVWVLPDRAALGTAGLPAGELLAEAFVEIEQELAVLVARRPGGETVAYPPVETVQRAGICRELLVPAAVDPATASEAVRLGLELAGAIEATGVLAVELFRTAAGLLVNELALRPHNSGHFSIEGCVTSQFENHLRAVADLPLGATDLLAPAVATVNVLGGEEPGRLRRALEDPTVHVHLYAKEHRPGRKLGHVTAAGAEIADARERALRAAVSLAGGPQDGDGLPPATAVGAGAAW